MEWVLRILAALKPALPATIVALGATMIVFNMLWYYCRNSWVNRKSFKVAGLFFSLGNQGALQLSCAWLKFVFAVFFVVAFQKMTMLHYIMFLFPALILMLSGILTGRKFYNLFWFILQTVGLVSTNLICGYYRDISGEFGLLAIYVFMGLFLILFSAYLFLNEVADVSNQRDVNAWEIWKQEKQPTLQESVQ